MASHGRHQASSGPSPLGRILKILYYIVFALALLIVIGYAAVRIIARDPTKDPNASYDPNVTIDIPPATEDPDASKEPSSVVLNRRLIGAAGDHAADMARRRYFAHESPDGQKAGDRVRRAGYRWQRYGENIARGAGSPYEVVISWMNSSSCSSSREKRSVKT